MKRRLYFILPGVQTAEQIENELLMARIPESDIHFLARRGTDMGDLNEATVVQKTDLLHGMWVGLAAGGATGTLVGAAAYAFLDLASGLGLGAIPLFAMLGAAFGVWASGMVGASIPSARLKSFHGSLEAGNVLLMVDVPKGQMEPVRALIHRHHPEAEDHGPEPTMPVFP